MKNVLNLSCTMTKPVHTTPTNILEDFLKLAEFAAAIKKHPRTVRRWCQLYGLPYTKNGKDITLHVPTYRQWLMDGMRNKGTSQKALDSTAPADRRLAQSRKRK